MSFENVDKLRRMTTDNNGRRQTTQPAYPRSFPWPRLRWQLTANSHSKIFFRKARINLLACFLYQGLNIWNKEYHKPTKFWLRIFVNSELRNEQIRPLFLSHFFIKNSQMFNPVVTTSLTVSTIHDALNPGPITSAGILDRHSAPFPIISHALKWEMKI